MIGMDHAKEPSVTVKTRGFATAGVMVRITEAATPQQLRSIAADLMDEAKRMEARHD